MGMLMRYYLDGEFKQEYLEWVASVKSDEYYIRMMQAWFFATALAKQWDATLPFINQRRLHPWTHNKAIQKATESYRITAEQKELLKTLRMNAQALKEVASCGRKTNRGDFIFRNNEHNQAGLLL